MDDEISLAGNVVIDGMLHRLASGYVACNAALNRKAWNVSPFERRCPRCFPETEPKVPRDVQGELFGA